MCGPRCACNSSSSVSEAETQARQDYRDLQAFASIDTESLTEKALRFQQAGLEFWKEYFQAVLTMWHPKN